MPATPEQRKVWNRRYYEKHKGPELQARLKKSRSVARSFVREYKEAHPCERCGFADPRALDLHHTRDKLFSVSAGADRGLGLAKIHAEVEKCIVLCANCHRIEHAERNVR